MKHFSILLFLAVLLTGGKLSKYYEYLTYDGGFFSFSYLAFHGFTKAETQWKGVADPTGDSGTVVDLPTAYGHGASNQVVIIVHDLSSPDEFARWAQRTIASRDSILQGKPKKINIAGSIALQLNIRYEYGPSQEVILHKDNKAVTLEWYTDEYSPHDRKYDRDIFKHILASFRWAKG